MDITFKTTKSRRETEYLEGGAMAGSNCRSLPCENSVLQEAVLKVCYKNTTLVSITVHLCQLMLNSFKSDLLFWDTFLGLIAYLHPQFEYPQCAYI